MALPKIITDFVAGPNVDNFLPFWFSGIIFFVLHLYKQRGYYQLSQLKFQWCDLSCLGESEYEFKIANRPPALRDLRLSGNVVSLYFSERENELCYSVSDRNTSGRSIIDCPLRKNKSALAELAGLIRSQRENKSFNDLSDQHQAAIRAEIEENIFLGKPYVISSTFFSFIAVILLMGCMGFVKNICGISERDDDSAQIRAMLLGALLGGVLSTLLLRFTTGSVGTEAQLNNDDLFIFSIKEKSSWLGSFIRRFVRRNSRPEERAPSRCSWFSWVSRGQRDEQRRPLLEEVEKKDYTPV